MTFFKSCSAEDTDLARWTISPDGDPNKATQLRKDGESSWEVRSQKKMASCVLPSGNST